MLANDVPIIPNTEENTVALHTKVLDNGSLKKPEYNNTNKAGMAFNTMATETMFKEGISFKYFWTIFTLKP